MIDSTQQWGAHIELTCKHHTNLRWTTKNIDYIGARSIFYPGWSSDVIECDCPASDLIVLEHSE